VRASCGLRLLPCAGLALLVFAAAPATPVRAKGEGGDLSPACYGAGVLFAYGVRFPERDLDAIVVATNVGLFVSHDAGATYQWICPEAWEGVVLEDHTVPSLPGVAVLPNGRIFVLSGTVGYRVSSADWCDFPWTPSPELGMGTVVSLAFRDTVADVVLASLSWPGVGPLGVYKSTDGGDTFAATSLSSDVGTFYGGLHMTYGGEHAYVMSEFSGSTSLWRSDDLGTTWDEVAMRIPGRAVAVIASGATDRDVVYQQRRSAIMDPCHFHTSIVMSGNAGVAFTAVRDLDDALVGAIARTDGLWLGWLETGIEQQPPGGAFAPVAGGPTPLACLGPGRGAADIVACTIGDASMPDLVRVEHEAGGEFTALVRRDQITGPLACGAETGVGRTCAARWERVRALYGLGPGGPIDGGPGGDGGTGTPEGGVEDAAARDGSSADAATAPGGDDGCGCVAAGRRAGAGRAVSLGAALSICVVLARRRRVRRNMLR